MMKHRQTFYGSHPTINTSFVKLNKMYKVTKVDRNKYVLREAQNNDMFSFFSPKMISHLKSYLEWSVYHL